MATSLPVATEHAPFLGVELRLEELRITADVAVELGERLGAASSIRTWPVDLKRSRRLGDRFAPRATP